MGKLYLNSGKCRLAKCGIETSLFDMHGNVCHTGDIVLLWSRWEHDDPENGFQNSHGLTAIVEDRYTTYSNGEIKIDKEGEPFVMGIKTIDLNNQNIWAVEIVKKYSDCINGEHWKNYGFNYTE